MYVANCSLKYNPDYFTVINKVLTEATQPIDVYTPTYSTGVTAKFDEAVYAEEIGKETTTFTATVVDTTTTWSDGTSTVDMADVGITDIVGAVDGSTIKITYSEGTEPRTELVGDPFIAHHCGGLLLDGGVFDEKKVDGKYVVTLVGETPTTVMKAKCSLLCDADKFEMVDGALSLKAVEPSGFDITWDGNTEGLDVVNDVLFKVSSDLSGINAASDLIGATIVLEGIPDPVVLTADDVFTEDNKVYALTGDTVVIVALADGSYAEDNFTKGVWFIEVSEAMYVSRFYKE